MDIMVEIYTLELYILKLFTNLPFGMYYIAEGLMVVLSSLSMTISKYPAKVYIALLFLRRDKGP